MSILLAPQQRRSVEAAESLLVPQPRPRAVLSNRMVSVLGRWLRIRSSRPVPDPELERLANQRDLDRERRELAHARYASLIRPF